MTAIVDAWRAVDPEARLVSGDAALLSRRLRGVVRTRAAVPHLPPAVDGQLLVVDAAVLPDARLDSLVAAPGPPGARPRILLRRSIRSREAAAEVRRGDSRMLQEVQHGR